MTTDWPTAFRAFDVQGLAARPASASDSSSVFELSAEGLRPYVEAIWGWDDDDQRRRHDEWWSPEEVMVFEREGRVDAFLRTSETNGAHDIKRIVVSHALRGRGVGTAIIRHLQEIASGEHRNIVLQVIEGNPAIHLYERLGFTQTHVDGPKIHMRWTARRTPSTSRS